MSGATTTGMTDRVLPHEACPKCGEARRSDLHLDDDLDTFTCRTCATTYVPVTPGRLAALALMCPGLIDWKGPSQALHDEVTYELWAYSKLDVEITDRMGRHQSYLDHIDRKVRRVTKRFAEDGILPVGLHDDSGIWFHR